MSDNFYRAFEDKHRGSRQDIKRRLQVYLPFVLPVMRAHAKAPCLDLGCGRGEWLELLTEQGVQAQGVDLDSGMLQAAEVQGLKVRRADAVLALQQQADDSLSVVSAFHLAEHLAFEDLKTLVAQALRVLVPGGLLILETPNPDNLQVATCNFHLDPSHIRPLPSALLAFLAQQTGFARAKVMGLQESAELRFKNSFQLEDVLMGASPDYAVVAQKAGWNSHPDRLSVHFARDYGITTAQLAQSYSEQQSRAQREIRLEMHDLMTRLHMTMEQIQILQHQQAQFEHQIMAIHQSALWRLSRPLEWMDRQLKRLRQEGLKSRFQALVHKLSRRIDKPSQEGLSLAKNCDTTLKAVPAPLSSDSCDGVRAHPSQPHGQEGPPR